MPALMLLAAAAILGGVVAVSMGWGGELGPADPDNAGQIAELRTPDDVATLRPRLALFGYQVQATSAALWQVACVLAERDAEIAELRAEVARLTAPGGPEQPPGAATRQSQLTPPPPPDS